MLHLALRGVRHNSARYIATLLAILTGVAFFSATGFVSDRVIDALEGDVDRQYGNVDVAVVIDDTGASDGELRRDAHHPRRRQPEVPRGVDGVEAGGGVLTGPVSFLGDDRKTFGDGTAGRLWITDEELNPLRVVEGSAPVGGRAGRDRPRHGGQGRPRRRRRRHRSQRLGRAPSDGRRHHQVRRHRLARRERHGLPLPGRRLRLVARRHRGVRQLLPARVRRSGAADRGGREARALGLRGPDRRRVPGRPARPGRLPSVGS